MVGDSEINAEIDYRKMVHFKSTDKKEYNFLLYQQHVILVDGDRKAYEMEGALKPPLPGTDCF